MKAQPLHGLRVLDFAHLLPGEWVTFWLCQLGADVIKVERPGTARLLGIDERHPYRSALNRGKRSIVLNLKREEDRAVARRLITWADVLVEGFRPGVMDRLGLGYETARTINPRLIYCSISGFGQQGPDRARPGHDNVYLALAGLLDVHRDASGVPRLYPFQLADVGGGTFPALVGILAALWARERTGEGTYVDVAMLEGALTWAYLLLPSLHGGPHVDLWLAGLQGMLPCYGIYETRDGHYIALGALEPHFWAAFCRAVDRPEWQGKAYDPALRDEVAALFRRHPLATWLGPDGRGGILNPQEVPVAPVRDLATVAVDEALWKAGALVRDEHGRVHPAIPLRFEGQRPPPVIEVPAPGEHTEDIRALVNHLTEQETTNEPDVT